MVFKYERSDIVFFKFTFICVEIINILIAIKSLKIVHLHLTFHLTRSGNSTVYQCFINTCILYRFSIMCCKMTGDRLLYEVQSKIINE